MDSSTPWPAIQQPRNQVVDLLNAFADLLSHQYPDLEGRVIIAQREDDPRYIISFYILNRKLGGYNTRLLSIDQPIDSPFPVVLTMHYKTYSSPPQTLTEANFEANLRKELGSSPVQNILTHLLALGDTMQASHSESEQSA